MNAVHAINPGFNGITVPVQDGTMSMQYLKNAGHSRERNKNFEFNFCFPGSTRSGIVQQKKSTVTLLFVDGEKIKNLAKINKIAALRDNWNQDGAKAFSKDLIERVRQIVTGLNVQPELFPTAANTIQLEYDKPDGSYLEIEIGEGSRASVFSLDPHGKESTSEIEPRMSTIIKLVDSFYG